MEGYTIKNKHIPAPCDAALLDALRRGKRSALEQILLRYGAYVAAVVRAQLGESALREDVEELSSDVFLTLWRSCDTLQTDHLRGWLGAVARNTARTFLRKTAAQPPQFTSEDYLCIQDEDAERLLAQHERKALIARLLSSLDKQDREIFIRYYYYGQTTAAIAAQLHMTDSTVRTRLLRGRKKLREQLLQGGYQLEDFDF